MDTYLPIREASNRVLMSEMSLNQCVQQRKIRTADLSTGGKLVNMDDIFSLRKEEWPEYIENKHLAGQRIWISQAARDYQIPAPTLSRWVDKGYILNYGLDGNKRMVDEADVAFCVKLYKTNPGAGNRRFSQIMDNIIKK